MFSIIFSFYFSGFLVLTLISYGFVDANFPYKILPIIFEITRKYRWETLVAYGFGMAFAFSAYLLVLTNKLDARISKQKIILAILLFLLLIFAFPGYSYDIFNYIATAKLTFFYKENPYLVMPIEIAGEPMLKFLHAANKTALYGFIWIILSGIPLLIGFGNLLLTIITFKIFLLFFYATACLVLYKLSNNKIYPVIFFALNPLILLETFISGHNDIVMMSFTLLAFYYVKNKNHVIALLFLLLAVFIKYAILILIPVFAYCIYQQKKNKSIDWQNIWLANSILLFIVFFASPLREEMYSWYLIWPLSFVSLTPAFGRLFYLSFGLSIGELLRFSPFIITRDWGGQVGYVKSIISIFFVISSLIFYEIKKKA